MVGSSAMGLWLQEWAVVCGCGFGCRCDVWLRLWLSAWVCGCGYR
jgi:hypothetical protein